MSVLRTVPQLKPFCTPMRQSVRRTFLGPDISTLGEGYKAGHSDTDPARARSTPNRGASCGDGAKEISPEVLKAVSFPSRELCEQADDGRRPVLGVSSKLRASPGSVRGGVELSGDAKAPPGLRETRRLTNRKM